MGLISSSTRLLSLNRQRLELESKIEKKRTQKMKLMSSALEFQNLHEGLDPNSPEVKKLEKRLERLKELEAKFDEQIAKYETQLKFVEAEFQNAQQAFDRSMQYYNGH